MEQQIAEQLLQINAIKLNITNPFTWASGWKSPIYCDNRKTLSYPMVREIIRDSFVELISEKFKQVNIIAGVATGAIAHGALVAEKMQLPFVYVRSASKSHGLQNKIEGEFQVADNVVVIEDLISTGGSSLNAVSALRDAGANVLGLCAIFSYGFDIATQNFEKANCPFFTLSNYNTLTEVAVQTGYINEADSETLKIWRESPGEWMGKLNKIVAG